jgi:hypothetical protein
VKFCAAINRFTDISCFFFASKCAKKIKIGEGQVEKSQFLIDMLKSKKNT